MDDKIAKAFEFAQEATKQLIGLATGVIALTITFLTDIVENASSGATAFLQAAWIFYLVSIIFGMATLLTLAGNLEKMAEPSIYNSGIVAFSIAQVLTFAIAIALTLVFGFKAV
jgi:hypothetical protein